MAGPNDPFTPGQTTDPTANIPGMDTFENLRNQWATFLDQPGARTALLQFGATLMQPPGFGETGAGQIGRALTAGGEAVSRGEALKSQESEREARASAAESRATAGETRQGLEYFRQQAISERAKNANILRAQAIYSSELRAAKANYEKAATNFRQGIGPDPGPKPDFPDYPEWLRTRGIALLGLGAQPQTQAPRQQQTAAPPAQEETETE